MATINIGDRINIRYPDNGEKNWGDVLREAFEALASYVGEKVEGTARLEDSNIFRGDVNVFQNKIKIRYVEESGEDIAEEKFNVLRVGEAEALRTNQGDRNGKNIDRLYEILGINDVDSLLPAMESALDKNAGGSAWNLFSSKLETNDPRENVKNLTLSNALTAIGNAVDQLCPVGSLRPSWGLSSQQFAYWKALTDEEEQLPGAAFIPAEFLASRHVRGEEPGYYRMEGGLWAPCDGSFPLPPNLISQEGMTTVTRWIPNLSDDVFLKGAEQSVEDVRGENKFQLSTNHIPQHSHSMTHTHAGKIDESGVHSHTAKKYEIGTTSAKVKEHSGELYTGVSVGVVKSVTLNSQGLSIEGGSHSHDLTIDEFAGSTDPFGNGEKVSHIPRNLPVAYYLRVR